MTRTILKMSNVTNPIKLVYKYPPAKLKIFCSKKKKKLKSETAVIKRECCYKKLLIRTVKKLEDTIPF